MPYKLTDWFPIETNPARKGVYLRKPLYWSEYKVYSYWDGKKWGLLNHTIDGAVKDRNKPTEYANGIWRGLANKPRERKNARKG